MHARISGVVDHLAENDAHALAIARDIVAPPQSPAQAHGSGVATPPLRRLYDAGGALRHRPARHAQPYDVREVIARLVDGSRVRRIQARSTAPRWSAASPHLWATRSAILANNGILFSESAQKGAHFIELCCQRRVPLVFLQNITGFMVGKKYEADGIARDGAKMVTAVACARVPKFTVMIGG